MYAVGGFNSSLRERTVDVYDGVRDQWSAVASMQERRSTLGAAVLGDLLYAVGGFNGSIGTQKHTHTLDHTLKGCAITTKVVICAWISFLLIPYIFAILCETETGKTKDSETWNL